ncbi:MAG: GspE/PulE family protein [Candidatus Sericytochromatia bacterium]
MSVAYEVSTQTRLLAVLSEPSLENRLYALLEGMDIEVFDDIEKAVEHICLSQTTPDVILLQVSDAEAQRFSDTLHADRYLALIPIILLLDRPETHDVGRLISLGATGLLSLPLQPEALRSQIQTHAQTRRSWWETFHIQAPEQPHKLIQLIHQHAAPTPPHELKEPFQQFKRFLYKRVQLSPEKIRYLQSYAAPQVYQLGEALYQDSWQMAEAMADFLHLELLTSLAGQQIASAALPAPFCRRHLVLALEQTEGEIAVVMANPFLLEVVDILSRRFKSPRLLLAPPELIEEVLDPDFRQSERYRNWKTLNHVRLGHPARPQVTDIQPERPPAPPPDAAETLSPTLIRNDSEAQSMEQRLLRAYQAYQQKKQAGSGDKLPENSESEQDPEVAPIIHLVNSLIEKAHRLQASDIHIEPTEHHVVVRYRMDGQLHVMHRLQPQAMIKPLIARLKIMSQLDMAEKRLPQDGKIAFGQYSPAHAINLRLSLIPVRHGEKAVLRLLDSERSLVPLSQMGFSETDLRRYQRKIRAPYGMILHVGPTGSGKTTTLYGALNELNSSELNIHTIENPVEYTLAGVNQLEVHPEIGLDFARALRAYLRQDPDVILVGEIRDAETAHVAVEAALTGHLLFSTLHTNDAPSSIVRLMEMGIPAYLISSSLLLICAQRLLRKLCPHCRQPYPASASICAQLQLPPETIGHTLYSAQGCEHCHQSGYAGRIGVYELLFINDTLRKLMNEPQITAERLKQAAIESCHMRTLFQAGVDKVLAGITSLEEISLKLLPDHLDDPD